MNRHEGVSCDSCLKNNFRGRRYKCLICIDYDLCAACYESGATTNQHTTEHPMQCILSRSDFDLYYGGEALTLEQPQAYTCPFCNRMGFTDTALMEHVTAEHADTTLAVVCPVCASMPGGEPNFVTDDFAGHLTLEHRTGPRDLISFLDEPSGIRHGGVRRMQHTGRGVTRARRTNMQFRYRTNTIYTWNLDWVNIMRDGLKLGTWIIIYNIFKTGHQRLQTLGSDSHATNGSVWKMSGLVHFGRRVWGVMWNDSH